MEIVNRRARGVYLCHEDHEGHEDGEKVDYAIGRAGGGDGMDMENEVSGWRGLSGIEGGVLCLLLFGGGIIVGN